MIKVWSLPTRTLHWTLVGAFCVAMYTRNSEMMRDIHVEAGYIAATVIVLRWIHGFLMRDFAAFRRFPPDPGAGVAYLWNLAGGKAKRYLGHNPAGAMAIYGMLLLGTFTSITGYMAYNDMAFPWVVVDDDKVKAFHDFVASAWLGLICLHITGVIAGSIAHRENLPLAMITGYKQRRLIPIRHEIERLPAIVRLHYIEEAAYYIAERRGFQAGQDWENWLQAEREIDRRLPQAPR